MFSPPRQVHPGVLTAPALVIYSSTLYYNKTEQGSVGDASIFKLCSLLIEFIFFAGRNTGSNRK